MTSWYTLDATRAGDLFGGKTSRPACANGWHVSGYGTYRTLHTVESGRINLVASADQPEIIRSIETDDAQSQIVRKSKNFFPQPPRTEITVGDVKLDRFAARLYADGRHAITGRLTYDGGKDRKFHGANVQVVTRVFLGVPQNVNGITTESLLFESTQLVWIPKGESTSRSLLAPEYCSPQIPVKRPEQNSYAFHVKDREGNSALCNLMQLYFDQISVIEVEINYVQSR